MSSRAHLDAGPEHRDRKPARRKSKRETKRIKGEIACAECRRLKVKCDRVIPCTTCVKRGCASLCPNGTIPPGEGSRFVIAATDHLQTKMSRLEERMRALEDALAIVHAADPDTDQPHPLLVQRGIEEDEEPVPENIVKEEPADELPEPPASVGALHIDDDTARFFGPSGGSEIQSLLLEAQELVDPSTSSNFTLREIDASYLPEQVTAFATAFPFTADHVLPGPVQDMIEELLPPVARATLLCDTFLEHLSWMTAIVSRQHLVKELIPAVYRRAPGSPRAYGAHDLALLLTVVSIGALVDLTLPAYNMEAQHYYLLARAAFALQSVLTQRSVVTIKTLHLMSIYNGMSGKEDNLEASYALLSLACQVGLMIGFHMDPSLWRITGRDAYERRSYFWSLLCGDYWQSLVTGRPPSIKSDFIDCKIPSFEDEALYQRGEVAIGFGTWGFRYAKEIIIPVAYATLAAKPPKYEEIMALDRKTREFVSPDANVVPLTRRTSSSMRVFVRGHYVELILLFLHRSFFVKALSDHPSDPTQCPYSHSFITAYQSACVVLSDTREQFSQKPLLCSRVWRIWSYAFSAAMVVGTVAAKVPHIELEPEPLSQFEIACRMFHRAAETSNRARRAMPVLLKIRQQAFQARRQSFGGQTHSQNEPDDELGTFGGRTRVVQSKLPSSRSPSLASPPVELTTSAAFSQSSNRPSELSAPSSTSTPDMPDILTTGLQLNADRNSPWDKFLSDDMQGLSDDLPSGWENLYRELPEPSFGYGGGSSVPVSFPTAEDDSLMLDDRWTSFMHNGGVLTSIPRLP